MTYATEPKHQMTHLAEILWTHPTEERGVGAALARFVSRIACAYRRQRLHDELMELDDHLLHDIGIARGDIPFIAANTFTGTPHMAPRLTGGATLHRLADAGCAPAPEKPAAESEKPLAA